MGLDSRKCLAGWKNKWKIIKEAEYDFGRRKQLLCL